MKYTLVLDTETTGLSYKGNDRLIEIGAVLIQDKNITGFTYQQYFNPKVSSTDGAYKVHKLSEKFLSYYPEVVKGDPRIGIFFASLTMVDEIVIHSKSFDLGFLKKEYYIFKGLHPEEQDEVWKKIEAKTICSRALGDKIIQIKSLDSMLKYFALSNGNRDNHHGALEDAKLTAQVYLKLREIENGQASK